MPERRDIADHFLQRHQDNTEKSDSNDAYVSSDINDTYAIYRVNEKIPFFRFTHLAQMPKIDHRFFTRLGGRSDRPFDSLNISYTVGDEPRHVEENLMRVKQSTKAKHLIYMNQSHGDNFIIIDRNNLNTDYSSINADALITNIPEIGLLVKQADCQGIVIYDPRKKAIANIHVGWRGNVLNIISKVITAMEDSFGCKRHDLHTAIGPSLGPCCSEFKGHEKLFPASFTRFMYKKDYFDLWAISMWQMVKAGINKENIKLAGICTSCKTDLFYSFRRESQTGRFGTFIMLCP